LVPAQMSWPVISAPRNSRTPVRIEPLRSSSLTVSISPVRPGSSHPVKAIREAVAKIHASRLICIEVAAIQRQRAVNSSPVEIQVATDPHPAQPDALRIHGPLPSKCRSTAAPTVRSSAHACISARLNGPPPQSTNSPAAAAATTRSSSGVKSRSGYAGRSTLLVSKVAPSLCQMVGTGRYTRAPSPHK
jgi:hypothetical protein